MVLKKCSTFINSLEDYFYSIEVKEPNNEDRYESEIFVSKNMRVKNNYLVF